MHIIDWLIEINRVAYYSAPASVFDSVAESDAHSLIEIFPSGGVRISLFGYAAELKPSLLPAVGSKFLRTAWPKFVHRRVVSKKSVRGCGASVAGVALAS